MAGNMGSINCCHSNKIQMATTTVLQFADQTAACLPIIKWWHGLDHKQLTPLPWGELSTPDVLRIFRIFLHVYLHYTTPVSVFGQEVIQ
jgi:hypothetical protein